MDTAPIGHNSADVVVEIEVRLFNSLCRFAGSGGRRRRLALAAGSTLGDVIRDLDIPAGKVFLALRNGRDVTPSLYEDLRTGTVLEDGDVIALSGPVPYSWGYGAPVV